MCLSSPGPVNLSTSGQLVAPAAVVRGTLSITASELYFEVDEDEPGFKAIDPKVRDSSSIDHDSNCQHTEKAMLECPIVLMMVNTCRLANIAYS